MRVEAKTLLYDMRQACERVIAFTAGKDYSDYKNDVYCRSAVERQFQIIGEALGRLAKMCPEIVAEIPSHRMIVNFRNILVHGYDKVDDEVVWGIVKAHLPAFYETIRRLLEDPGE
jgi:uncharacterized protein with HEPN domain